MIVRLAAAAGLLAAVGAWARDLPSGDGVRTSRVYALTQARLVIRPGEVVERGVLVLRDGVIVAVGAGVAIPQQARVLDLQGRTVFAGFIDANSDYAQVESLEAAARPEPPLPGLSHPSTQIHAQERLADRLRPDPATAAGLRRLGFTSVASQPRQGIFRGQAAVLSTADAAALSEVLVTADAVQALAFDQNPKASERYPVFTAGSTSLIRQAFLDARWYQAYAGWGARQAAPALPERPDLLALQPALARRQPVFIEAKNEFEYDRAWRVADEFGLDWVVAGNGHEYRYAGALKAQGARVIVPLAWPQAPQVADEEQALEVSLAELEHWEWAPFNARVLAETGVPFAFTAAGLKDPGEFWTRLRQAVALGLDERSAIAALTEVPARLLGLESQLGSLQPGRRAQLVVADADLFRSGDARIHEVWVDGQRHVLATGRVPDRAAAASAPPASKPALPGVLRFPGGEFGRTGLPAQPAAVLVHGATVWTQGAQGVLEHADVLVERGRIRAVGRNLKVPAGAVRIDGTGLHLTPGLIDTHSHIAINRGNDYGESSDRITGEVGNADILKPTDLAIYHQLADGVTAVLLLQGSGNPINGQSQAIKLRWGADAEGLKIAGAPPSMKLALGENAKQSNWGRGERYPLTRMGVHESVREAFEDARAYVARQADRSGAPQRRDLRLEAVAEILSGRSTMHVHSYRQGEVLAFMRLSHEYGVAPVFHHLAEGYKVADEMAALGAGASAFVDYWGMKWETDEATVYNAAMMVRRGVRVSLSSDSTGPIPSAGGPRLNLDASYTVRFGGLKPDEALGLVTLNAAAQMGLGDRMGSLEPGKDADFVLWSDDPLSPRAIVQQTWIDGRRYFDRGEDRQERERIEAERARLIARIRNLSAEDAR